MKNKLMVMCSVIIAGSSLFGVSNRPVGNANAEMNLLRQNLAALRASQQASNLSWYIEGIEPLLLEVGQSIVAPSGSESGNDGLPEDRAAHLFDVLGEYCMVDPADSDYDRAPTQEEVRDQEILNGVRIAIEGVLWPWCQRQLTPEQLERLDELLAQQDQ